MSAPAFVRTPDDNFTGLTDFPFAPHYVDVDGLRMHYVDEGPADAPIALMVHGMPTWSYLYRTVIATMTEAGYRCVAPDHIGFGRSDKVTDPRGTASPATPRTLRPWCRRSTYATSPSSYRTGADGRGWPRSSPCRAASRAW